MCLSFTFFIMKNLKHTQNIDTNTINPLDSNHFYLYALDIFPYTKQLQQEKKVIFSLNDSKLMDFLSLI